jgi:hypothetical protein
LVQEQQLGGQPKELGGALSGYVFIALHIRRTFVHDLLSQKVLLSFLIAAAVAASECILYIIWESRRSASGRPKSRHIFTGYKKDKEMTDIVPIQETQQQVDGLRQRVIFADGSS